jgi:hypothetical protein
MKAQPRTGNNSLTEIVYEYVKKQKEYLRNN